MPGRVQDLHNLSIGIEGTSSMVVVKGWQSLLQNQAFCLPDDKNLGAPVQRLMRRKCCTSQNWQNSREPDGSSAVVRHSEVTFEF